MSNAMQAMQAMQFDALVEFIKERNGLVEQINAATGDKDSLAESFKNADEFEELRNQIAELQDALDAQVAVKVEAALANSTDNSEELLNKVKEIDGALNPGLTYFKKVYGEKAAEELPKRDRVKGTRTGGGGGGGGKRIRGYNWIVTIGDESTEYENAATAAKALDLETKQLQEAFFAKAGVEKIADAPNEVTLQLSWTDTAEDGTETEVTATVRAYRTTPVEAEVTTDEDVAVDVPDEDELANI